MDDRQRLMKKIQELAFAKDETILYLDTHPNCQMAIAYYRDVLKNLDAAMEEYQNKYGPIYHEGTANDRFTGAEGAWPWQNEKMGDKR